MNHTEATVRSSKIYKQNLNKNMNTIITKEHKSQASKIETVFKCSLCDNHFKSNHDYEKHIVKHLEEITNMNLTLGNEYCWVEYMKSRFECNI